MFARSIGSIGSLKRERAIRMIPGRAIEATAVASYVGPIRRCPLKTTCMKEGLLGIWRMKGGPESRFAVLRESRVLIMVKKGLTHGTLPLSAPVSCEWLARSFTRLFD